MEALKTNQEIVHEGWLIKSPPPKLWKARWRHRWFTLRHSGELPGQYFLEYFTDRRCRKLKGRIDLDQCEQVDAGLRFENHKEKYQFMFNIKTPKRTYYLVAENEIDMNKWVDAVCQVCGLKAYMQDEEPQCQIFSFEPQESPPTSPISTMSDVYIPISECFSGPPLNDATSLNSGIGQGPEHYDAPRKLAPSPPRSPTTTDADSVFTDDESVTPKVNWDTFPSSGELRPTTNAVDVEIGSWSVKKRFGKLRIVDSSEPPPADEIPAPPRPPKPSHFLTDNPGHNYLNLDGATESSKPTTPATPGPSTPATAIVTDETYDFPRSHQPGSTADTNTIGRNSRHNYSNAAPTDKDDRVFRYDFQDDDNSSIRSESTSMTTVTYSNLPSPLIKDSTNSGFSLSSVPPAPPIVYRDLKPGRKTSDSLSIISNEPSPSFPGIVLEMSSTENSPAEPPSINRKLKPTILKSPSEGPLQLASPPGRGRVRPISIPLLSNAHLNQHPSLSDEDNNALEEKEEVFYYQDHAVGLQYIDLDLGSKETFNSSTLPSTHSPPNSTVYKTVDFLKTEAFNRTRQKVEEERKQCTSELA